MDARARELERRWRATRSLPDWLAWARHVHRIGFPDPLVFYRSILRFLSRVRRDEKFSTQYADLGSWARRHAESTLSRIQHGAEQDARRAWRALGTLQRHDLSPVHLAGGTFDLYLATTILGKTIERWKRERHERHEARRERTARNERLRDIVTRTSIAAALTSTREIRCAHWHVCSSRIPALVSFIPEGWSQVGTAFVCPRCQTAHSLGVPVSIECRGIHEHDHPRPRLAVSSFQPSGDPPEGSGWGRTEHGDPLCPEHFPLYSRAQARSRLQGG